MKLLRRFLLTAGLLLTLLLMAGCMLPMDGLAIDTQLTVSKTMSGSRVMQVQIPASVYKKVFSSDSDKLKDLIMTYTPGDMYCVVEAQEDGGAVIKMNIDFASYSDYQKKIETICKGNKKEGAVVPKVNFDYSASIFKNGYTIDENFTSMDLFYWLSDAMKDAYPSLQKEDLDSVFKLGTTEVIFSGESSDMSSTGYIHVSTIKSNAFSHIQVDVRMNSDHSLDAEVVYKVRQEVVNNLGTSLDTVMKTVVPKDAKMDYKNDEKERVYTLTFHSANEEQFCTDMNTALKNKNTIFEIQTEGDTESLAATMSVTQSYDGSYFLDYSVSDITYILEVPEAYSLEDCQSLYGYVKSYDTGLKNDWCRTSARVAPSDEVTMVYGFAVDLDTVSIRTHLQSETHIEREIVIKMSADAEKLIGDSILERWEAASKKWEKKEAFIINKEAVQNGKAYSVTFQASSSKELSDMTCVILGENEDEENQTETFSVFQAEQKKKTNPWQMDYVVEDTLNLSSFLKGAQVKNGIFYELTYPKYYKAAFTEKNLFENGEENGAVLSCTTNNHVLLVKSQASKVNILGISIFGLWGVSLFMLILIALMHIKDIIAFVKKTNTEESVKRFLGGRQRLVLAVAIVSAVCFVFMTIRLIFKIY